MTETQTIDPESVEKPDPVGPSKKSSGGLFRAYWRWHFYASFLVIPVLLVLAGTGLVYLLRFQIEPVLHADLMKVSAPANTARVSYEDQKEAVFDAYPGAKVTSVLEPSARDRSTDITISTINGETREVYVDPYSGKVLGSLNPDTTISGYAKNLHRNFMAGDKGAYVMELGACWAIVMAITGYYMYWRGRAARARRRLAKAKGAMLRHRHATVGLFVGVGLLALVVSGLPWTIWWGDKVQSLATNQGTSMWSEDPGAQSSAPTLDASVPHSHNVPWGQGKSLVPSSPGTSIGARPVGIDTAIAEASRRGLAHPMTVIIPDSNTGVYSVMGYAFNSPSSEGTVHINQFTGKPMAQYGYGDYPTLAKVVDQGIALHEGRRFGSFNLVVSAAFCLAVIFMCIAGPIMWWRRRPRGNATMAAPRGRLNVKTGPFAVVGLALLAVGLPVFGVSLVVVFALDQLVVRRVGTLKSFFNTV